MCPSKLIRKYSDSATVTTLEVFSCHLILSIRPPNDIPAQKSSQLYCIDTVPELTHRSATGNYERRTCPKVPTWRLEWTSNLRPSTRKAQNIPLGYHAPQSVF